MNLENIGNGEYVKKIDNIGCIYGSNNKKVILLFGYSFEESILQVYAGVKIPRKKLKIVYGEEITGPYELLTREIQAISNNWRILNHKEFLKKLRERKKLFNSLEVRLADFTSFKDC